MASELDIDASLLLSPMEEGKVVGGGEGGASV